MPVTEFAPLKLNLFLHVTGRRADGYHLLQSLFVYPDYGDRLAGEPAPHDISLTVEGPFSDGLSGGRDNLVLRAARLVRDTCRPGKGIHLILRKNLPVASGIGGGSADAAAALRLCNRMWGCGLDEEALEGMALQLGADVPAAVKSGPCLVEGTGEVLTSVTLSEDLHILLVNPGKTVSTAGIFAGFRTQGRFSKALDSEEVEKRTATDLAGLLSATHNDLEPFTKACIPEIGTILELLMRQPGCHLARMSGSGATCFGLFESKAGAQAAAAALKKDRPAWWVQAAGLMEGA